MWFAAAGSRLQDAISTEVRAKLAALRDRFKFRGYFLACGVAALGLTLVSTPAAALLSAPITTVTTSANPSFGSPVTFTVAVTSSGGTPDGTMIFLADLVSLGSATLDGTGHATFTTSTLAIGVHVIVAVYVGNLNFLTSTSIGVNVS